MVKKRLDNKSATEGIVQPRAGVQKSGLDALSNEARITPEINNSIKEFSPLKKGEIIKNPSLSHDIGLINEGDKSVINSNTNNVTVSRLALKHIVEQRGENGARGLVNSIPDIVSNPTKIAKSTHADNRYIFAKKNGGAKASVLEVIKNPDGNQVVSAYYVDDKTYRKLVDISGRPDVPSSLDKPAAESGFSAVQKVSDQNLPLTQGSVNVGQSLSTTPKTGCRTEGELKKRSNA